MDRDDNHHPDAPLNGEGSSSLLISSLLLDNVGEVVLTHNSDGLSWKSIESMANEHVSCLGINLVSKRASAVSFHDIFAVEFTDWGLIHESALTDSGGCFVRYSSEMYRFSVHFVQKSKTHQSLWVPSTYTFGHKDSETCQLWVHQINTSLNLDADRPKSLLVFVHPRSGKGNGRRSWEAVTPIFSLAKVKTKVIETQKAGHAFDVMASITCKELNSYDGVIAVGGDGFFSEILNGLLLSRHKASYPPRPTDIYGPVETNDADLVHDAEGTHSESSAQCEDESPLLMGLGHDGVPVSNLST